MPKTKVKSLKDKLWKIVSLYIRKRDADWQGMTACATCGIVRHYKEMDAGHFVPKTSHLIQYDERNIHPQCHKCNRYLSGNIHSYWRFIQSKYGEDVLSELNDEKRGQTKTWTIPELEELIVYYKNKLDELEP